MDLSIDNDITKKENNIEIANFTKELSKYVENINTDTPELYKVVFNEVSLAQKYKRQLSKLLKECLDEASYEKDFYYFDYDNKRNKYYFDYYSEGNRERTYLTKKDLEGIKLKVGMFYRDYNDTHIVEAEYLIDGIKIDMDSKLYSLDLNNSRRKNGASKS